MIDRCDERGSDSWRCLVLGYLLYGVRLVGWMDRVEGCQKRLCGVGAGCDGILLVGIFAVGVPAGIGFCEVKHCYGPWGEGGGVVECGMGRVWRGWFGECVWV